MNRTALAIVAALAAALAISRTTEAKTGPFRKMFSPLKQYPTTENKTGTDFSGTNHKIPVIIEKFLIGRT